MQLQAIDNETKRVQTFDNFAELHTLIAAGQVVPLREDGTRARVQELMGGYLIDGLPLNVLMTGEWEPGQRGLMEAYYDSGQIKRPAAAPPPEAEETDTPTESAGSAIDQGRALTMIAAAGVLGFLLGRRFL